MGTSVRKTAAKIKKLLNDTLQEDPSVNFDVVIPDVAKETMKSRKTKGYFSDKDFPILVGGGISCFKRISSMGFNDFITEHSFDPNFLSALEIQKVIEAILDKIEQENGDIQSSFLLTAFKLAATAALVNKTVEPEAFLTLFCQIFLEMVIREGASEELTNAFSGIQPEKIDNQIKTFSKAYVNDNFKDCINRCASGELDVAALITKLQNKLK